MQNTATVQKFYNQLRFYPSTFLVMQLLQKLLLEFHHVLGYPKIQLVQNTMLDAR